MLCNTTTSRGNYKRRRRGNVKDIGTITPCPTGINQKIFRNFHFLGEFPHNTRRANNLVDGLSFHTQPHQKRTYLRICCLASHYRTHCRNHFFGV